jgi:hypothetical protein
MRGSGRGLEVCQWPDPTGLAGRPRPPTPRRAAPGAESCQCHPSESAASLPASTRHPGPGSESTTKLRGSQLDAATGSGCRCGRRPSSGANDAGAFKLSPSPGARARGPILGGRQRGEMRPGRMARRNAKGPNLKPPRNWRAAGGRDAAQSRCARLQLEQPEATTSSPQAQAGRQRGRRAWEVKVPARSENASV